MEQINPDNLGEFVQQLTSSQSDLRAYILAALGNYPNMEDVLQRTNITLWQKANTFEPGSNFLAWSIAVAKFEILRFLRDTRRDRHVFDMDVVEIMFAAAEKELADSSSRQEALRECLGKISKKNRILLWKRYDEGMTLKELARDTGRSIDSLKSLFLRIRRSLEDCIRLKLGREST